MIEEITTERNIGVNLEFVTIKTVEEAIRFRHIGGPTIQINGLDIELDARNIQQFGLS